MYISSQHFKIIYFTYINFRAEIMKYAYKRNIFV